MKHYAEDQPNRDENGLDADGLDKVSGLVADAVATEGQRLLDEGGAQYAERVIRRALQHGTLVLARDPNEGKPELGFVDRCEGGHGRTSIKKSYRAEGRNFVD